MMKKTTLFRGIFLMACCLAVAGLALAQTTGQWGKWCYKDYSYTGSAQTFTVPANCTKVTVEAIGGGGAGGYAYKGRYAFPIDYYRVGGGGGGAAYARTENMAVSTGSTITINIGQGGRNSGDGNPTTVYYGGTKWLEAAGGKHGEWSRSGSSGGNLHAAGGAGGAADDSYYIGTGTKQSGGTGGKAKDFDTGLSANQVGSGSGGGAAGGTGGGANGAAQASGNDWAISSEGGNGGGGNASGLISGVNWLKGGKGANGRYWENDWGAGFAGNAPGAGGSGGRSDENHGPFAGGDGGDGFVRVWFYIESSSPLTASITTTSTSCPYTLTASATNEVFTKNYKWSTGATSASITVSPSASTTYTVTVTDVYTAATNSCQITSTYPFTVSCDAVDCSVSISSATATPTEVCAGGDVSLSVELASTDASTNYEYVWMAGGSNVGTGNSVTVNPTANTTYTVSVTATKGSCTATDTRDVTVTVTPKVDPVFASLQDKYCAGSVPAVSSLPTTSDNGITGTWAVSVSGSSATFTFTPSSGECANTFVKTATLVADPTPGTIEPDIVVCDGSTTYTFNNATSAAGGVNGYYAWQVSLDQTTWYTIPSASNASYVPMTDITALATLLGISTPTGTFYYRRAWANDCGSVFSNVLSLDNPGTLSPGSISVTGNDAGAYCADKNVSATLTANPESNPAGATFSYQWQSSTDGTTWANISGATASSYSVSLNPVQKISYRYQVKYSTCDWMTSNNTYDLTVKPVPVVLIEGENPYNVSKCANKEITVTVTGADSYEWQNHSTANPATFPATSNGSYVVTGTATNGCTSTATITITNNPLPTIDVVTPSTASQSITYGQPIADVVFTTTASSGVTVDGLPAGLTYTASTKTISGTPTVSVGTYTITATAASEYGCDAATKEITINVGKKALTITYTGTGDNQKVYDGDTLELSYDKLTINGLVGTDQITSGVIKTDGYKAGTYVCTANSFERMWADGQAIPSGFGPTSVTQNYSVTFNVTLTITKRLLEITAKGATKEYDATPLTPPDPGYEFTGGTSLAPTDEAEITVTGSQLCPGSSNSTVNTVVITHQPDGENVNDSYTITKQQGTLTVTPMACPATKTFEGYDYPLVQIGDQCWFAENLRAAATDAVPYDEESANTAKFGLLYNWSAALAGNNTVSTDPCYGDFVQGICPDGWAIPSAADFDLLKATAGDMKALRSNNAEYWVSEYIGTNTTGFDERGGGLFNASTNRFEELKSAAYFWTSESVLHSASFGDGVAHSYCDEYYCGEFIPKTITVYSKLSVRCVRKTYDGTPSTTCPSLGATSLKYRDNNLGRGGYDWYSEMASLTLTTPINDFDASQITKGKYVLVVDGSEVPLVVDDAQAATIFSYSAAGLVANFTGSDFETLWDRLELIMNDHPTNVILKPVLTVNCSSSPVDISGTGYALPEGGTSCPNIRFAYPFYTFPTAHVDYYELEAFIGNYDESAINVNQCGWTLTSDNSSEAPYTFIAQDHNTNQNAYFHSYTGTFVGEIDRDYLISKFPNSTELTATPFVVINCGGESTLTGLPVSFLSPAVPASTACPASDLPGHQFTVTKDGGMYKAEFTLTEVPDVFSIDGSFTTTSNTTPTVLDGSDYGVTFFGKITIGLDETKVGTLNSGDELNITVEVDGGDASCTTLTLTGTYVEP